MILCGYVVDNNMKTEPTYSSTAIVVAAAEAATKDIYQTAKTDYDISENTGILGEFINRQTLLEILIKKNK